MQTITQIIPHAVRLNGRSGTIDDGDHRGAAKKRRPQPVTLGDLDGSNPQVARAIAAARQWAERKRKGCEDASLILVGPNGTGKTHIAKAILWSARLELDGEPVAPLGIFFDAPDLMRVMGDEDARLRDMIPSGMRWAHDSKCPMVVVDDVGAEGLLRFVPAGEQLNEIQARYFRIVNYCYQNKISLIVTASNNCGTLAGLSAHLGARSWDRLCQMAPRGFMLEMTGVPSWRQRVSGRRQS